MAALSLADARRLAVAAQGLVGPPPPTVDGAVVHRLVHDLGCVQLDPTAVVARNPDLVLWSRLGRHDRTLLPRLLFGQRRLLEYWAHAASIVDVADLPIHRLRMRTWHRTSWGAHGAAWLEANAGMVRYVLRELRRRGPLRARDLDDRTAVRASSSGWNDGRSVGMVLERLHHGGKVLVADRRGRDRVWGLPDQVLPPDAPAGALPVAAAVEAAAARAVRALGVARVDHVREHFTRWCYPDLERAVGRLVRRGTLAPVEVENLPGTWYVHDERLAWLDAGAGVRDAVPRTTLLSPFDNLIADRARTRLLHGVEVKLEIYTPPAQRRWGYFVLPVLHGHDVVGRADLAADRNRDVLAVLAFHDEAGAAVGVDAVAGTAAALRDLAAFVGVTDVDLRAPLPPRWRGLRTVVG